ncbi:hypothetical protein BH09BAC2_BH09BAC2_18830 [soil metagenome]
MEEVVGESPTLMNKLIMMIYILFALIGCQSSQEKKTQLPSGNINYVSDTNRVQIDSSIPKPIDTIIKKSERFEPDTTVNKKLFLENYLSSEKFYAKINVVDLVEKIRSSPVVIFSNTNNDEYLLAYQYEGNSKNSFSSFEIGYVKSLEGVDAKKIYQSNESSFKTESGLKLGLSFAEIVNIKGKGFKKKDAGNETILSYRIEDYDKSTFLRRYNMPGYFIELVLKEDKVIKVLFGFDYP